MQRLDVIHRIQEMRAIRSQKVLVDSHYIWNALNCNHYNFLFQMITNHSFNININILNIFNDNNNQLERDLNEEMFEQANFAVLIGEYEEENRILSQSSIGVSDTFEDSTVLNPVQQFSIIDHSASSQASNNGNENGNNIEFDEEYTQFFDGISFYIRQAAFSRANLEAHLRYEAACINKK